MVMPRHPVCGAVALAVLASVVGACALGDSSVDAAAARATRKTTNAAKTTTVAKAPTTAAKAAPSTKPIPASYELAYTGKLEAGWVDYGWSSTRVLDQGAAQIEMSDWQGWIVAHSSGTLLPSSVSALELRYKASRQLGRFLLVSLRDATDSSFKEVSVPSGTADADGWFSVSLPIASLSPSGAPFDRIVFRPDRALPSPSLITVDQIRFVKAGTGTGAAAVTTPASGPARPVAMSIDCTAGRRSISPLVYGVAYAGASNQKDAPWSLNPGANRWGGNPTSRYNWELGNAWNTALDYYWRNVTINASPNASEAFLNDNASRGIVSALTVPTIGWVSKDTSSASFPVSQYGSQQSNDPDGADAGNGVSSGGKQLEPGSPKQTSVPATPEFVGRWVAKVKGRVGMYILDNEPDLWDSTHRDVHPEPVTYDELFQRTIDYARAIRRNDPAAVIAGPASWGWPGYLFSSADAKAGFDRAPDRKAHGNTPLLPWYLQQVRAAEKRLNLKLLDVLDVHFYPQGANVAVNGGGGGTDAKTAALRIRSTRALWDPTYRDESWINDNVMLIPRLQKWIDENAPGVGISIGEWNFGGENHISGGLATAEALGRFGQNGVTSAYYWTVPPTNSPSYWGFRAFRDVDGKGLKFLDTSVATQMAPSASLFASTDAATSQLVAVALNLDADSAADAKITTRNCKNVGAFQTYTYDGSSDGFAPASATADASVLSVRMAPHSITVIHADLR